MPTEKVLSIIIPTYNMEKYLHKCLSSLIIHNREIFHTLEVLIINDGSTDSSSAIALSYVNKYPDVFYLINKQNGHYGSCINAALSVASGKYVKILDADDYFNVEAFQEYLTEISLLEADMVINDMITVDKNYQTEQYHHIPLTPQTILSFESISSKYGALSMHKIAYKTSILIAMQYKQTEGIPYTDVEWVIKPIINVKSAVYLPIPVYYYLLGREGQSMNKISRQKSLNSVERLFISLLDFWKAQSFYSSRKEVLFDNIIRQLWVIYYGFFVQHVYFESDFKEFDSQILSSYPEVKESIDNFWWIRCNFFKHPVKDWRERRLLTYHASDLAIRIYRFLRPSAFKL